VNSKPEIIPDAATLSLSDGSLIAGTDMTVSGTVTDRDAQSQGQSLEAALSHRHSEEGSCSSVSLSLTSQGGGVWTFSQIISILNHDRIAVADGTPGSSRGVVLLDVSDPENPVRLAEHALGGDTSGVYATEDTGVPGLEGQPVVLAVSGGMNYVSSFEVLKVTGENQDGLERAGAAFLSMDVGDRNYRSELGLSFMNLVVDVRETNFHPNRVGKDDPRLKVDDKTARNKLLVWCDADNMMKFDVVRTDPVTEYPLWVRIGKAEWDIPWVNEKAKTEPYEFSTSRIKDPNYHADVSVCYNAFRGERTDSGPKPKKYPIFSIPPGITGR